MNTTEDVDPAERIAEYCRLNPDAAPVEVLGALGLSPEYLDAVETNDTADNRPPEGGSPDANPGGDADASRSKTPGFDAWDTVDFSTTEPATYPPALLEREQWMGRLEDTKLPFAPWGDKDHPEADAESDARYKWGLSENHVDGATVAIAEDDPRLDGRVFIQQETDPFAFVDGDDVRDPETGDVHPGFIALLEHLGATFTEVSTSGAGIHAHYDAPEGLPIDGKGQATFEIDTEPWGANADPPTVEIYANKHVCVTTGDHVEGTPREVREWDAGALRAILEANGYTDKEVSHDTDREREDLDEYDPEVTAPDDTAEDVRDILKAVDRLEPRDVRLKTRRTGEDATGWPTYDPSYRSSESGESLHYNGEGAFYDHKEGESFGVLGLFAAEEGIISNPWDRLAGGDWWDAVGAAREQGAPIPEYINPTEDTDPVAVLPPGVRDLTTAASGWDWKHAARETGLTVDDVRERTKDAIADAYADPALPDRMLVEALPTMGKSYGAIAAAAETDTQITVVTGRGRNEQYQQFREWCDTHGLSHYTLPSFTRDCDTANGEHGEELAETVLDWYRRGATPKQIHKFAEYHLGHPLPCQHHDGARCPYTSKWDFDPDEYDVLIGHYKHAYQSTVTSGRVVVFDEFPDAYETTLGPTLQGAVSYWLESTGALPFDSYTDLLEERDDQTKRGEALLWFDEHGVEPDESHVFDDASAHAAAPLAAYTLLASEDLGNGLEQADLEDVGTGVFNRATGGVHVLRPPALEYASGVVALDGTPTKRMWELSLGERLNHREILQGDERAEYLQDALNLNLVRTTEYVKPYNSGDHVAVEKDGALLEAIAEAHDRNPSLITTMTAKEEYDAGGVLSLVDETKHYGDILGSNQFDDTRLGAVIGGNHYGDHYIKKWGAYAGEGVTVDRSEGKGRDLSYSGIGDEIHTHMVDHDTLQAVMRFGRDGNGAVVYVHTNTLPDWVPIAGEGRVLETWSEGMTAVIEALEDLDTARTEAVVDHPAVDLSRQQVFDHLETLRERGYLAREQDPEDGRGYVWRGDELHRINDHGEVDLEGVSLEDLDEPEVRQLARSSSYTWEFTNLEGRGEEVRPRDAETLPTGGDHPQIEGDPPPDPAD